MTTHPVLSAQNLTVEFKTRAGIARVLDNVSLDVSAGDLLGIVGESGCGKSMTALAIMGLVPSPPGQIVSGRVLLDGNNLTAMPETELRHIRGRDISMIFQEPMSSLNPVFTVGDQIAEVVRIHENVSAKAAWARAVDMLRAVDIPEATVRAKAYPHQLSGGMRQRVMIAIGLVCHPKVLIADEPTTALDATVQAQIFDLLRDLQKDTGTAIVLITHDMGAVAEMADRVAVMYAGCIIEHGLVDDVLSHPKHPYTRGLIECVPHLDNHIPDQRKELFEIPGVVPALTKLRDGCAFAPRCSESHQPCLTYKPALDTIAGGGQVACHLHSANAQVISQAISLASLTQASPQAGSGK